ncbi:MAG: BREX-2 system phosphatase PglZ, partial [Acetobacteraceae bacterium]|nr:BREX-2 system phosphatase PglZ [Acetobacteraceae bacterium]
GFEARLKQAAGLLTRAAASGRDEDAASVWAAARRTAEHDGAEQNRHRVERLWMAARLARWLTGKRSPARTMAQAAALYCGEGGFVDCARKAIRAGDPIAEIAAAYADLGRAVTARREEENRAFAAAVRDWNAAGGLGTEPLPIEQVLQTVAAPLAREAAVLVLVFDGLSFAVWRELDATFGQVGWKEIAPRNAKPPQSAVAVLPSITVVSRASLLCGSLTRGDQADEKAGFATHPGLLAASRAGKPPRLFHKADLGAGPELSAEVREAVANPEQRVVGIVHNAIDAQLSGSDQLDFGWTTGVLKQLAPLLQAARGAGRIVVVTGDHGHVLEDPTTQAPPTRWREAGAPAADGEMALSGGRILPPSGGREIVAAWTSFAGSRGGYHGGVSPQEVLVPIAVLASGALPAAWDDAPPAAPEWWDGTRQPSLLPSVAAASAASRRPRFDDKRQPELFPDRGPGRSSDLSSSCIDTLLASEPYSAQRRLAGRGAPADEQVRALLTALAARGGRMTLTALATALAIPKQRAPGLVNASHRVLNLDQTQVLTTEGDEVVLDQSLLCAQFGLRARRSSGPGSRPEPRP